MDIDQAGDLYEDVFINNRTLNVQRTSASLYAKLRQIFRYEGLPLTLPKRVLEGFLLRTGQAVVYEHEGDLFVTEVGPTGEADLYGDPRDVTIEHRAGSSTTSLARTVGIDCVLVRNDSESMGVDSLVTEFAILTAQAKITLLDTLVNLRNPFLLQAKDENARRGAEEYIASRRAGDPAFILAEEFAEMEGIVVHATPTGTGQATQAIEVFQYIQSYYYSEFGVSLNNNMKREYVSDSEIEKATGMPLIDDMLSCRQEALRDIKALFGVDITIALASEWAEQEVQDEQALGSEEGESGEAPSDGGSDDSVGDDPGEGESPDEGEDIEREAIDATPEPEAEEVSAEELISATEALTGDIDDQTQKLLGEMDEHYKQMRSRAKETDDD